MCVESCSIRILDIAWEYIKVVSKVCHEKYWNIFVISYLKFMVVFFWVDGEVFQVLLKEGVVKTGNRPPLNYPIFFWQIIRLSVGNHFHKNRVRLDSSKVVLPLYLLTWVFSHEMRYCGGPFPIERLDHRFGLYTSR